MREGRERGRGNEEEKEGCRERLRRPFVNSERREGLLTVERNYRKKRRGGEAEERKESGEPTEVWNPISK